MLRMVRLFRQFKELVLIISGIVHALRACLWIASLLILGTYMISIFFVEFIGRDHGIYPGYTKDMEDIDRFDFIAQFNPYVRFGSVLRSMSTLFNVALLTEWPEITRPVALKQPWLLGFFVLFAIVATFGVMNVIVGVVVEHVMTSASELARRTADEELEVKLNTLQELTKTVFSIDLDGDGQVTLMELSKGMSGENIGALLGKMDLPRGFSAEELFSMLDNEGTGLLDHRQFVRNFFRLIESSPIQRSYMMQADLNDIKTMVKQSRKDYNHRFQEFEDECRAMFKQLFHECRKLSYQIERAGFKAEAASAAEQPSAEKTRRSTPDVVSGHADVTQRHDLAGLPDLDLIASKQLDDIHTEMATMWCELESMALQAVEDVRRAVPPLCTQAFHEVARELLCARREAAVDASPQTSQLGEALESALKIAHREKAEALRGFHDEVLPLIGRCHDAMQLAGDLALRDVKRAATARLECAEDDSPSDAPIMPPASCVATLLGMHPSQTFGGPCPP